MLYCIKVHYGVYAIDWGSDRILLNAGFDGRGCGEKELRPMTGWQPPTLSWSGTSNLVSSPSSYAEPLRVVG